MNRESCETKFVRTDESVVGQNESDMPTDVSVVGTERVKIKKRSDKDDDFFYRFNEVSQSDVSTRIIIFFFFYPMDMNTFFLSKTNGT